MNYDIYLAVVRQMNAQNQAAAYQNQLMQAYSPIFSNQPFGFLGSQSQMLPSHPSIRTWACDYCGSRMEWRATEPGPCKCGSCGAPRK